MKGLIVAAGKGERIASLGASKPLIPLLEKPLIEWVMDGASRAGVRDFVVITGHGADRLTRSLEDIAGRLSVNVETRFNPRFDEPNGLSVFAAREMVEGPFILLMTDHIFDPAMVSDLMRSPFPDDAVTLVVDYGLNRNEYVDLDDVTKVQLQDDRIVDIGKEIPQYNAYDTGIFRGTPLLFDALEENLNRGVEMSISAAMRLLGSRGQARGRDSAGRFWIDVDDEPAFHKTEEYLRNHCRWL